MTPLEAAARAMWEKHADEPLQVGKWKEPTDYREFKHLSDSARATVLGFARAAISAYLKACAEDEDMCTRTELHILEQFTGGMRYDRAVDHWLCPLSEQAARNLMSNARVAVLSALEPKE